MKFPITREELQRFDYTIEMKQKRERDIDNKIEEILQRLCTEFEKSIQTSSHEKKFIWAQVQKGENSAFSEISNFIRHYQFVGIHSGYDHVEKEGLIDSKKKLLLDKIRKLFIGCDIILDPLHTYIIIDWS
jgi:hypothetical protein